MNKKTQKIIDKARQNLEIGNSRAYARMLSGLHRGSSVRQQKEIEAVIKEDNQESEFRVLPNGALIAVEF